jgi:putative ABC transport system substrate-binding protein
VSKQEITMRLYPVGLVATLAFAVLVAPLAANAQPAGKVHRIGFLHTNASALWFQPLLAAFRQGLRDFGYVEGQNLVIEYRSAEGHAERLPALAAELVQLPVEVLVAPGPSAGPAAQQATKTLPIVIAVQDPVEQGLIASFAHPGGNITGVSFLSGEILGKQLELLKEAVPQLARVAVVANPTMPGLDLRIHRLTETAEELGLHLHVLEVGHPEALEQAWAALLQAGDEALFVVAEPTLIDGLTGRIIALAAQHRLPAMCYWKFNVEAGCLMSYGPSLPDWFRRFAHFVDRLLKGAKAADLPVELPTKYELVINLKTAKALGITFPPTLLVLADEVIQ